jgi:hypothetical protein
MPLLELVDLPTSHDVHRESPQAVADLVARSLVGR